MIDQIVADEYRITKKLGQGAFGKVYQAISVKTNKQVAIKIQANSIKSPQLFYEARILQTLNSNSPVNRGIPRIYSVLTQDSCNIMIMDLFGSSLQRLFDLYDSRFDLKTVLMIGIQMLERIEFLHECNILHRDIKPDNFVMGHDKKGYKVYLIDFGLAKKYLDKNGNHIPYKDNKNLTGTARYASLNTHLGIEQGRRDDLECIGNVLLYFLKGSLPWQNMRANNKKEKYEKIMDKKLSIPLNKLCLDIPNEFQELIRYSRCLQFQETPDYKYLKDMFKKLMQKEKIKMDYGYCWGSLKHDQYDFSEQ